MNDIRQHVLHLHAVAATNALRAARYRGIIKTCERRVRPSFRAQVGLRIRQALSASVEASQVEAKEGCTVFPGVSP